MVESCTDCFAISKEIMTHFVRTRIVRWNILSLLLLSHSAPEILFRVPSPQCITRPSFYFYKRILDATLHIYLGKHAERGMKMSDVITSAVPFEHPEQTGPLDPHEINPKMASDIAYWSKALGVTGEQLHEAIRVHGTHVGKVCAALHTHKPR